MPWCWGLGDCARRCLHAINQVSFKYVKSMDADKNNDGEITVSELRTYVSESVQELTNGLQKPTMRQENIEFDFRVW